MSHLYDHAMNFIHYVLYCTVLTLSLVQSVCVCVCVCVRARVHMCKSLQQAET